MELPGALRPGPHPSSNPPAEIGLPKKSLDTSLIEQCIVSLKSDIEKYSLEAEEKQDLTLLSKS